MIDEKKLFQKFFKGQILTQEGYNYRFDSIERRPNGNLGYNVCWLPDYYPHSYFIEKIKTDIYEIVKERLKYLGETPTNDQVNIYTEKGDLKKRLYIKKSLLNEINFEVKSLTYATIGYTVGNKADKVELGIRFNVRDKNPYYGDDSNETININYDLNIISAQDMNGKDLKFNPALDFDSALHVLQDTLYDMDLPQSIDDISIPILEPEIKIGDYEIYYSSWFQIKSILGVTNQKGETIRHGEEKKIFI
jgi:hypothetical protein